MARMGTDKKERTKKPFFFPYPCPSVPSVVQSLPLPRMGTSPMRSAVLLVISVVCLPLVASAATTIHVAPNGDDSAPGTEAAPLRTVARARDAARALKHRNAAPGLSAGGVQVVLHGGTYYLDQPLVLTDEDSGAADAPVRYE